MPTGVMPRESSASWSTSPSTTTRLGAAGMVVVPSLWFSVTGNPAPAPGGAASGVLAQPAATTRAALTSSAAQVLIAVLERLTGSVWHQTAVFFTAADSFGTILSMA
ncbi:hypothetical protein GCM10010452_54970 [Crossiella cryophila]